VVPRRSLAFVLLLALTGGAPAADLSEIKAAGGLRRGTTWEEAARAAGIPGSRIDSFPDMEGLLQALRDKRNAAVVMSLSDFSRRSRWSSTGSSRAPYPAERRGAWGARPSAPQNE
jgi:hypothetical protein